MLRDGASNSNTAWHRSLGIRLDIPTPTLHCLGMAALSLDEIAAAMRSHIVDGTMNIDFMNAKIHPMAHMTLIIHANNLTPTTSTPQYPTNANDQNQASVYSRGSTPGLAAKVVAAFQMPQLDPASQLSGDDQGQGNVGGMVREQNHQTLRPAGPQTRSESNTTVRQTAYPASLASRSSRKPKKIPKPIDSNDNTRKGPGNDLGTQDENEDGDDQGDKDGATKAAKEALVNKWGPKIAGFSEWKELEKHAFIGSMANQEPYADLDRVLERIQGFGAPEVQEAFVRSVHTWLESGQATYFEMSHPDYLDDVGEYDAKPFQRMWRAMRSLMLQRGSGSWRHFSTAKLWSIQWKHTMTSSKRYRRKFEGAQ